MVFYLASSGSPGQHLTSFCEIDPQAKTRHSCC